jgi:hypothetical protein
VLTTITCEFRKYKGSRLRRRLLAYNHYLEKTVVMNLLSAACGTYVIILDVIIMLKQKVIILYNEVN